MTDERAKESTGGVPSRIHSREVTEEDRRAAIEAARREQKPLFHLTDGHISHIRSEEAKSRLERRAAQQ